MQSLTDPTRFILVDTSHPGNVGATARAMKVMGFSDLVLVSPRFAVSPGDELRVETWVRGGEALVDEFGPFGVRAYRMQ